MNKDNLGQCRTCGELISKILGTRGGTSGWTGQGLTSLSNHSSGSCPHCGEADPHLTDEEVETREQVIMERLIEDKKLADRSFNFTAFMLGVIFLFALLFNIVRRLAALYIVINQ